MLRLLEANRAMRKRVRGEALRDDRGATMLLVSISLVMLLLFGAMAVDLGAAWSQRRENQAAVDSGTVAGALQTRAVGRAAAIAASDAEIVRITYQSIQPNRTIAEWINDWTTCTDPDKGPEYTITGASQCISYTNTLTRVRVKLPDVDTNTFFAAIIGVDTLQTNAEAEVIISIGLRGYVMPFGLPGGAAGNTEACLKTGANPQNIPPCDGPATGNFGFLGIGEYGNDEMGTTTSCIGVETARLARNIARGVDHPIVVAPSSGASFRHDLDGCLDGNLNYAPYTLTTDTGNRTGALHNGLIDGVGALPGRLTLSTDTVTLGSFTFDDKPLWEYLNADGAAFCAPYRLGPVWNHDEMIACVANMTGTFTYFDDSLIDSPRFGWVPLFHGATLGSGNTALNIDQFRPVFIQTSFWSCNALTCDIIHDPSEPAVGTMKPSSRIDAISGIQLPKDNLPPLIADAFFGEGDETIYAITD